MLRHYKLLLLVLLLLLLVLLLLLFSMQTMDSNDWQWAAQSVEAARMEEGAACNDASAAPGAACNDASAAPRIFEAKQCFKSCRMSQRMAPSFKASPTVVATLYCSYRCHAAVLGRFGLRVTKRMPSPSSAFITRVMADQEGERHIPPPV